MTAHTARRVVLFDLDGVLTHQDTFTAVTKALLRKSVWRALLALPAIPVLFAVANWPYLQRYPARYLVRIALLGWHEADAANYLDDIGRRLSDEPGWLVDDGARRAREHLANGDRVIVTTATERVLARSFLNNAGLAEVELIASELQRSVGGLRLSPHNFWKQKPRMLKKLGDGPPWSVLYTDSLSDLPLMSEADQSIIINPTDRTAKIAVNRIEYVRFERWS